jgi:hypothetical protein
MEYRWIFDEQASTPQSKRRFVGERERENAILVSRACCFNGDAILTCGPVFLVHFKDSVTVALDACLHVGMQFHQLGPRS